MELLDQFDQGPGEQNKGMGCYIEYVAQVLNFTSHLHQKIQKSGTPHALFCHFVGLFVKIYSFEFLGSPGVEDKGEMDNRSIYVGNVRLL